MAVPAHRLPLPAARRPARSALLALAFLVAGWCPPPDASAEAVDRMNQAAGFYGLTGTGEVTDGDGVVTLAKTGGGDCFVRWSLDAGRAVPLDAETERIEIDFDGFAEGGAVQVMLMVDDAAGPAGQPVAVVVEEAWARPGRLVVPSVSELAERSGSPDPMSYHLFFRVANDPTGSIRFDQIRLARRGSEGPPPADAAAGVVGATVDFAAEPVETGMRFDRSGATRVAGPGGEDAWSVQHPTGRGAGHQRSFVFDVTEPALVDGQRPSIDVEVTYLLDAWGAVHVVADTADGPVEVGDLWGNAEGKWKTGTVRLDTARLGNGLEGGFDLRLSGDNGPLLLKQVRLTGYDPRDAVRWDRLLEVESKRAVGSSAGSLFVFEAGRPVGLSFGLRNHALAEPAFRWRARVLDDAGEAVAQDEGELTAAAGGVTPLDLRFDAAGWPLGPYTAEVTLSPADAAAGTPPVFSFDARLGVVSDRQLEKARPGRFAFGLDAGEDATGDESLAWYTLMGVDLLRSPGNDTQTTDPGEIRAALDRLDTVGVRSMLMVDPPGQIRPITEAERERGLAVLEPKLESLARDLRGTVTYYELGNEPDLPFFYPGTVEEYLDSFHRMSDAIRRGNPDALVMNGGLCFFGEVGDRRAREIIAGIGTDRLDVWGYHGHGPGGEAEHDAYERQVEAVTHAGKAGIPYLDTETGMSATSPAQLREQSRTGVQKTVIAQAVGMPSLMWFRLNMPGEGYTLTDDRAQPRPTVLSYRAMVERLREARFAAALDTGVPGVEAYLFEDLDPSDRPTGAKTLVAWNNDSGRRTVSLRLDAAGVAVEAPTVHDLYGNPSDAQLVGTVATLPVGIDPVYLTWSSAGPASAVVATPPALGVRPPGPIAASGRSSIGFVVRNDGHQPLQARLELDAVSTLPLTAVRGSIDLQLPPRSSRDVEAAFEASGEPPLALPRWWHAFTGLDAAAAEAMGPAAFADFPASLPAAGGGAATPRLVWAEDHTLDLAALAGGVREREPVILFASIDAPEDTDLAVGAGADWWMRWYVNGELVCDTFDAGNGGTVTVDAHRFTLPLRAGRNVVAAHVRSGTAGFKLVYGDAAAVATAEAGGISPDRVSARLIEGDRLLAEQLVAVRYAPRLPAFADLPAGAGLPDWLEREPAAVLGEERVVNSQEAHPDRTRWYGGRDDLSAVAWVRDRGDALDVVVAVRDAGAENADADALRLSGPDAGESLLAVTAAGDASGPAVAAGATGSAERLTGAPDGFTLLYRVTLPADRLDAEALVLTVRDTDAGIEKQEATSPAIRLVRR